MTIRRIIVWLALSATMAACSQEPEAEQIPVAAPVEVRAVAVRRGDIAASLEVPGETVARDTLRLGSPVAGRVSFLDVRPGDRVGKGQVVARVLPLENEAALNGFGVLEEAGKLNGEDKRIAHRLSEDIRRHDISLRAPFSGVVAARLRNPGEQLGASDVLLELFDPSTLHVLAQVPIDVAPSLRPGARAELALGNEVFEGRVDAALNAVTPQALTVPVRIALASPLPHPLLGAPVRVRVFTAVHRDALLIPPSALLAPANDGVAEVLVAAGERGSRRRVRIGLETADAVEIVAGLSEGDLVLVAGQYGLPEAAPIIVRPM